MILLVCLLLTVGTVLPTKPITKVANMSIPGYSELLTGDMVELLKDLLVPKLVGKICTSSYYGRLAASFLREELRKTGKFARFEWTRSGAMFSEYIETPMTPQDAANYTIGGCGSFIYGSLHDTYSWYSSMTVGCRVVLASKGFLTTCYFTLQDYCENKP